MPKRSSKPPKQKDTQQLARSVLDRIAPDAEPQTPKKKPPRPVKKQDATDLDRADSEGMAQPQGKRPKKKNPAAVALGRLGGAKGGKARAAKLTPEQRAEIAKKAAKSRWNNKKPSSEE